MAEVDGLERVRRRDGGVTERSFFVQREKQSGRAARIEVADEILSIRSGMVGLGE